MRHGKSDEIPLIPMKGRPDYQHVQGPGHSALSLPAAFDAEGIEKWMFVGISWAFDGGLMDIYLDLMAHNGDRVK